MKTKICLLMIIVALTFFKSYAQTNTFPSTGNVGIGTSSPLGIVDIRGQGARFIDSVNTFGLIVGAASSSPNWVALGTSGTGVPHIQGYSFNFSAATGLSLQPNGGNVFIGTNEDDGVNRLQVNGSGKFMNDLRVTGTSSLLHLINTTSTTGNEWRLNSASNGKFSIRNVTREIDIIELNGDGIIQQNGLLITNGVSDGSTTAHQFRNNNTNIGILGSDAAIYGGTASNFGMYVYGANDLEFSTDATKRLVIKGGGAIGIGTTTPQKTVDIVAPANDFVTVGAASSMGVGQYSGIHFGYREHSNSLYRKSAIVFERTDDGGGGENAAGKIHILNGPRLGPGSATMDDARLTIDEYGSVGINTRIPRNKLDVKGGGMIADQYTFSTLSTGVSLSRSPYIYADEDYWIFGDNNTLGLQLSKSPGTSILHSHLKINGNLKLGLGNGTQVEELIVNTPNGTSPGIQLLQDEIESWTINNPISSTDLVFSNSHVERLRIKGDGNVGIGTNDPGTYKLNVCGKIRANEVKVNLMGCDFVFASDYKLMSLKDLEKFIEANKHLPEILPAAEMEKDGTDLGELNSKLLQKVEELTLYIIEQNKRIEALENKK